jgi:hypothetical protein
MAGAMRYPGVPEELVTCTAWTISLRNPAEGIEGWPEAPRVQVGEATEIVPELEEESWIKNPNPLTWKLYVPFATHDVEERIAAWSDTQDETVQGVVGVEVPR